jgi:hypothetical protein
MTVATVALFGLATTAAGARGQTDTNGLCPHVVGMYSEYMGEQFSGTGTKDEDLMFWARYNFVAHNQGGLGPIEMAGFVYLSKPECWLKGDRGVFTIVSPIVEYYGPRRDGMGGCDAWSATEVTGPADPTYDPYANSNCGNGGSVPGPGSSTCTVQWVSVEESYDGGVTWQVLWEGYAEVCA